MRIVNYIIITLMILFWFCPLLCIDKPKNNELKEDTWYIAKLKPELPKYDVVDYFHRDNILFTVTQDQIFLYVPQKNAGFLKNDKSFKIPNDKVIKIDTIYFKFEYSKSELLATNYSNDDELYTAAKRMNINLKSTISNIFKQNQKAFINFIQLYRNTDGASAEMYVHTFWEVINILTDDDLSKYLKNSDENILHIFTSLIFDEFVTYPVLDQKLYFDLFYPKSMEILRQRNIIK